MHLVAVRILKKKMLQNTGKSRLGRFRDNNKTVEIQNSLQFPDFEGFLL